MRGRLAGPGHIGIGIPNLGHAQGGGEGRIIGRRGGRGGRGGRAGRPARGGQEIVGLLGDMY